MPRDPSRATLSRSAVLAAAVALADEEGADAVSMRRLSETLGVVPMALYKHVANKEDLLDGMVEQVLGEIAPTPTDPTTTAPDACWEAAVRHTVMQARAMLTRHPWARRVIETRQARTPAVLVHMERLTSAMIGGGLAPDLAHHAMHTLGNRIWGFSPELFTGEPTATRGGPALDPADYPGILAVAADARARRPGAQGCDEDAEFAFALDLILDALARLHATGWSST